MDDVIEIIDDQEDFKLHGTQRNRKRRVSSDRDGSASPSTSKKPPRSKRFRLDSTTDEEDHDSSAIEFPLKATSSTGEVPSKASSSSSTEEDDPFCHLEERSAILQQEFPQHDQLTIQDALLQNDVSLEKARRQLQAKILLETVRRVQRDFKERSSSASSRRSSKDGSPAPKEKQKPSKKKAPVDFEEEEKKYRLISDDLYDSEEESDQEEDYQSEDRQQIVQFLQEVPLQDLVKLKGISEKKANIVIEARPFSGWKQLISTLRSKKHISVHTVIDAATDYLNSRSTIMKVMGKCQKLSKRIEDGLKALGVEGTTMQPPTKLDSKMKLQPYQLEALRWLSVLHENNVNGILADEMGLGKTIQSIAFIALLMEKGVPGPFLIIAPASTIDNWDDEFRRWASSIRTVVYHGSLDDRSYLRQQYFSSKGNRNMDVIITTYDGATRNVLDKSAFKKMSFSFAVFDEAHLLKNMTTNKYRSLVNTIRADGRLLLTGTPVQNNLTELISLLVFAMPNMLSKEISSLENAFNYISKNGEKQTLYEAQQIDEAKVILKPFILRRTKESVALQLPSKTASMKLIPMSDLQKELYKSTASLYAREITEDNPTAEARYSDGLDALHQLRKVANHPLLIRNRFGDDALPALAKDLVKYHPSYANKNPEYVVDDLRIMSDFQLHQLCLRAASLKKYRLHNDAILDSGKFNFLDSVLPDLKAEGHKVLLFSQYTQILDVVESYLGIRKHKYARIDGSTPVAERQDIVDRYNTDPGVFVMLLSTRAGGLGINLTGADTVVIHDVDFNPYNDKQAENRCHRLGQKKEVTVFRLISEGTIEESIYEIGQKKLELERNVVGKAAGLGNPDSPQDSEEEKDLDPKKARSLVASSLQKLKV